MASTGEKFLEGSWLRQRHLRGQQKLSLKLLGTIPRRPTRHTSRYKSIHIPSIVGVMEIGTQPLYVSHSFLESCSLHLSLSTETRVYLHHSFSTLMIVPYPEDASTPELSKDHTMQRDVSPQLVQNLREASRPPSGLDTDESNPEDVPASLRSCRSKASSHNDTPLPTDVPIISKF